MLGLCTVNMLWLQILYAQRLYTSFGQVAERALGFTPTGLAVRQRQGGGRAEIAVLSQSPPGLHIFGMEDSGGIVALGSTPLAGERRGLTRSDAGGEGGYISLTMDGRAVSLLSQRGTEYAETLIAIPVKSQRIRLADINGDGRMDILLYGRNRAGVSTLLGKPGGGFAPGPELFSDLSISDLRTADINGDGIPDVILCDWLSNRLVLFYGISRMVFSEQVTVDIPGEPAALACTWLKPRRMLGVAVAIPSERKIIFLKATPAGDILIYATMQVPGRPLSVEFASLNDDAFLDIVAPAEEGTIVSTGAGPFQFNPPTLLGPGAAPAGWALADFDGDGRTDFAVAERTSRRLVLMANAQHGPKAAWPSTYAAGSKPRGLLAMDLDGDGLVDIAVANSNSSTVSILFNRGQGRFSGGAMAFVSDRPAHLTCTLPSSGAPPALICSHTSSNKVGVLAFENSPLRASTIAIPTGSQPYVLHAWVDSVSLKMLLRYAWQDKKAVSLAVFEQISGGQFLERSMRFSPTDRIAAATIERSASGPTYTVAYITSSNSGRISTLQSAEVSPFFEIGSIKPELTFSDSTSSAVGIIPATLRQGGGRDYIVLMGKPVNALMIAYRNPDGSFRSDPEWIRNVSLEGDDDIIVEDVDGDGRPDITVRDESTESIDTYYGGPLGFGAGVRICSARGVGGIAIAPLVSRTVRDLILSHSDEGTVSILFDPFRR
jgi:hypothetical protein